MLQVQEDFFSFWSTRTRTTGRGMDSKTSESLLVLILACILNITIN
jgi:hypothetical protein